MKYVVLAGLLVAAGCDEQPLARVIDAGVADLAGTVDMTCAMPEPQVVNWHYVYTTYFGDGTAGHCGASGCHDVATTPAGRKWLCGTDEATCYQGMLKRKLLNPLDPPASDLISPVRSPLVWFNLDTGNMPRDDQVPNFCAARDLPAWLNSDAGATPF